MLIKNCILVYIIMLVYIHVCKFNLMYFVYFDFLYFAFAVKAYTCMNSAYTSVNRVALTSA